MSIFKYDSEGEEYFIDSQRTRVAAYILNNTTFGHGNMELGVQRLVNKGVYVAAYPLHDGPAKTYKPKKDRKGVTIPPNDRYLLYTHWAKYGNILKTQPNNAIRDYFGAKIGLYFAWVGEYNKFLILLSIIGIGISIYGAVSVYNDPVRQKKTK